jgi:hypothetical protein
MVMTRQPIVLTDAQPQSDALAQREHQGHEDDGDQDRAHKVDRFRAVRIARFRDLEQRERHACGRDRGIEPEQALPAREVDEDAPDQRACRGLAAEAAPQIVIAFI